MYSLSGENTQYRALSADDVNMLKMAATGDDLTAGTNDDYTVTLNLSCEDPIAVLVTLGDLDPGVAGQCAVAVDYSYPPQNPLLARHYSLSPDPKLGFFTIYLNDQVVWDLENIVFEDGFESGTTSSWEVGLTRTVDQRTEGKQRARP